MFLISYCGSVSNCGSRFGQKQVVGRKIVVKRGGETEVDEGEHEKEEH